MLKFSCGCFTHPLAYRIYVLKAYLSFLLELVCLQPLPNLVGRRVQKDHYFLYHICIADL